ncbi:MAG TPA: sigma-70 family RNA polymerase sigma factor [Phycisphaerae bacterium]|nr:sigma-70 family RNA polymerase sigma factor [Phycisphaerae bacterium]HRR85528.1 sigma-70 family RNA polymerase sigma factor [Phycisphaerae bacterium]
MRSQAANKTQNTNRSAKNPWYAPDPRIRSKAAVRDALNVVDFIRTGTGMPEKPSDHQLFIAMHTCAYMANKSLRDAGGEHAAWTERWFMIREYIVQQNLGLAYSMMSRFNTRLIDEDDLLSDAMLGLTRAVDRYNPWRGYRFSTYACNVIVRALMRRGKRERNRRRLFPVQYEVSLEQPDSLPDTERELYVERLSQVLRNNMGQLTDLETRVLAQRFTGEHHDRSTFQEIGEMVGLSKERVRQIQNIAIRKLRQALAADPVLQ